MEKYQFIALREKPDLKNSAAEWFHSKWKVPIEAYLECMDAYLQNETEYGWYLCLDGNQIVGGTVCLSTSGCRRSKEYRKGIVDGLKAFLDVCTPRTIIVYGDAPEIDCGNIEIIEFQPFGFGKQFISERKK